MGIGPYAFYVQEYKTHPDGRENAFVWVRFYLSGRMTCVMNLLGSLCWGGPSR